MRSRNRDKLILEIFGTSAAVACSVLAFSVWGWNSPQIKVAYAIGVVGFFVLTPTKPVYWHFFGLRWISLVWCVAWFTVPVLFANTNWLD